MMNGRNTPIRVRTQMMKLQKGTDSGMIDLMFITKIGVIRRRDIPRFFYEASGR
ncbi:MAG: hypothetical protein RLZZ522_575 [Verrucomicrobiota bacterium]